VTAADLKLLVIDDHALTREGMRLSLQRLQGSVSVLEAASGEEADAVIQRNPDLDLVLLDLGLPGAGGMALLEKLRRDNNAVPVMVISGADDRAVIRRALDLGAMGYIPKTAALEVLLQAVRLVLAGGTYVPMQALAGPSHAPTQAAGGGSNPGQALTERQRQILALMAQGHPNKIIAAELAISEATVKSHVTEILRILRVSNRTQAVIVAGTLGIA
jgi:DNA-binding NarL/FixJ family response regulator